EAIRAEQMRGAWRGQPVQQVDLGRRVGAIHEPEQSDGEGESGERRATREIEVHARERSGRGGGQIAHDRATRGFKVAWARSPSRLAATWTAPMTSARPGTSGMSRLATEYTMSRPSPGYAKISSTITMLPMR